MSAEVIFITSRHNQIIQEVIRLRKSRQFRYEKKLFIADGLKLVNEALKWKADVLYLVVSESIHLEFTFSGPVYRVPEELMAYISSMEAPQGIIAVIKMPAAEKKDISGGSIILDHIQDPGNLGTIIRTADALSVPVFLTEGCADPYNEKTVRATMGAIFRSPPVLSVTEKLINACSNAGISLAAADLTPNSLDLRTANLTECAVVIGNEGHGVSEELRNAATSHLIIPIYEGCESLNAAIAATIFMWQIKNDSYR